MGCISGWKCSIKTENVLDLSYTYLIIFRRDFFPKQRWNSSEPLFTSALFRYEFFSN